MVQCKAGPVTLVAARVGSIYYLCFIVWGSMYYLCVIVRGACSICVLLCGEHVLFVGNVLT